MLVYNYNIVSVIPGEADHACGLPDSSIRCANPDPHRVARSWRRVRPPYNPDWRRGAGRTDRTGPAIPQRAHNRRGRVGSGRDRLWTQLANTAGRLDHPGPPAYVSTYYDGIR